MKRRTFLLGIAGGAGVGMLAACTPSKPVRTTPPPSPEPLPTPSPVPQPQAMLRSNWSEDPFAGGSASFTAVGATADSRVALGAPVDDRLFFAGEATATRAPGTVDGARESGIRVANEVLGRVDGRERIAVIGAGMAGLTTARALADAGHDVVVIEARDRIGGRIDTRTPDSWPFAVDLGAGMLSADDTDLRSGLAAAGGEITEFTRIDEVRLSDGTPIPVSGIGRSAVVSAVAWSAGQPHDVTLQVALDSSEAAALSETRDPDGVADTDWLAYDLLTSVEPRTGASSARLSAWNGDAAAPGDGIGEAFPLAGFAPLIDELADGLQVVLKSAVTRVTRTDTRVSLRMSTGESLTVDRAVVTVPLGVLKAHSIRFEPDLPLPSLRAASVLGMGAEERVWLRYDQPFWSTDATVWTSVATGSPFAHWVNLLPDTGEPILVGTLAADHATQLAGAGDTELLMAALASLEPFLDPATLTPATDAPESDTPESDAQETDSPIP